MGRALLSLSYCSRYTKVIYSTLVIKNNISKTNVDSSGNRIFKGYVTDENVISKV